jgi:hypothetical protein
MDQGMVQKTSSDKLLRYNVNGIELDVAAFFKLKTELALQRVGGALPGYSEKSIFWAGRYPDRDGTPHWLLVREAPIRLWIGNNVSTEEDWGRRFYEVITDPNILALVKQKLASARSKGILEDLEHDLLDDDGPEARFFH